MQLDINLPYVSALNTDKRYIVLMGGRAGGRSYFASQYATARLRAKSYFRCAIMRLIAGDIRNSIFQEIKDRLEEYEIDKTVLIKENTLEFVYGGNSIKGIGFKKSSGDQKAKLKSLANFNCVIIEEADEIAEEDFMQLDDSLRTIKSDIKIFLMFNPPSKNHWIIKRWFNLLPSETDGFYRAELKTSQTDTLYIHATYKDNELNLNQSTIENFKQYKQLRPDHYYNMVEGLVSEGARGRIFKNWKPISDKEYNELPFKPYYGMDFGFTNDPTALGEIKEHNNKVWIKELIYETGMTNPIISKRLGQLSVKKGDYIYADCAEPKSIAELQFDGWKVEPAIKGADSIIAGIDYLLGKEIYYTESSINIAREIQEYKWALDKNKEPLNEPVDDFNHIIDAIRYGVYSHNRLRDLNGGRTLFPTVTNGKIKQPLDVANKDVRQPLEKKADQAMSDEQMAERARLSREMKHLMFKRR